MDITRVAAISPIIKIKNSKGKDPESDAKSREDKKGKEFEKTLKSKKVGEIGKNVKIENLSQGEKSWGYINLPQGFCYVNFLIPRQESVWFVIVILAIR